MYEPLISMLIGAVGSLAGVLIGAHIVVAVQAHRSILKVPNIKFPGKKESESKSLKKEPDKRF